MRISIIGASAGVGLECVHRALERGHEVVALSRRNEGYPSHPNLTIVQGSATKVEDLKKATEGAEAVLVTLGTGKSTKATTLYTEAAKALIELQKQTNTPVPFIILTGFGAGESGGYHPFFMGLIFKTILKAVYKNKTQMEQMLSSSTVNWEFVRPGLLLSKPLSEKYRIETRHYKGMNIGGIARKDVADYMVKEAEQPKHLKQSVALSNK